MTIHHPLHEFVNASLHQLDRCLFNFLHKLSIDFTLCSKFSINFKYVMEDVWSIFNGFEQYFVLLRNSGKFVSEKSAFIELYRLIHNQTFILETCKANQNLEISQLHKSIFFQFSLKRRIDGLISFAVVGIIGIA